MEESLISSCVIGQGQQPVQPCSIVLFGASGDLTRRKLMPALFHLFQAGQLPDPFRIIGVARRPYTDDSWREELRAAVQKHGRPPGPSDQEWERFAARIFYCRGDLDEPETYRLLAGRLQEAESDELRHNILFYLATRPSQFAEVVEHLHRQGLVQSRPDKGWQRIVVEKPFGHDLASARALNETLARFVSEEQLFRIDHYLGKETVQNIMMFRFSNAAFERLWNRDAIEQIQITVSETAGVGDRAGYYEEAGALRDMLQNHLLQVLALVTMEPPVSLEAESIRDEKVKLLRSVRRYTPDQAARHVVRGQYTAGQVDGRAVPAYREEPRVRPDSCVETYVAARLFLDNWRWSGVPIYLRTGKRLARTVSEVRIQFRPTPHVLFAAQCSPTPAPNAVTLRLQPREGISLRFNGKVPGLDLRARPVRMHFDYNAEFGAYTPEAYERLLRDALAGDATLFLRRDEIEAAWAIADCLRAGWEDRPLTDSEFYPAGSWGPPAADTMIAAMGHTWHEPLWIP
ncbi:glucose-6-phosphate dehydrogenase [Limisphaera sp. 4302-co]|uniref:glucose-6-phosphate dehydrogenase n=1 Tax=Limisphaera sp. 4302-co TaxID=3400417 RepID=UPI003C299A92